jgi:putative ABC transport system substrate-binding protein
MGDWRRRKGRNVKQRNFGKRVWTVVFLGVAGMFCACSLAGAAASIPTVGVLTPGLTYDPVLNGLREGLEKVGYKEGRTLKFIVEDSKGYPLDFAPRAAKLAESKPEVLFTVGTATTLAAKRATGTIPIIFTLVGDPIQSGVIAAFASSGNNVTGVSSYAAPLSGKRLELLTEIVPKAKNVLLIVAAKESSARISARFVEEAAKKMGVQLHRREVAGAGDIEKLLNEKLSGTADAIFLLPSLFVMDHIDAIVKKAKHERLPLIVNEQAVVVRGALASYGGDFRLFGLQAAKLVAKVLKGYKPSDIPIETPDRFILVVNLTTAKAIGIKMTRKVLERADRLVE